MSLKAVELQIAIPKTFDAGKIADQHNQNIIHQQMHANEAAKREFERSKTIVNETEDLHAIRDDEESQTGEQDEGQGNKKNNDKNADKVKVQHPFKGNFFDFSG